MDEMNPNKMIPVLKWPNNETTRRIKNENALIEATLVLKKSTHTHVDTLFCTQMQLKIHYVVIILRS